MPVNLVVKTDLSGEVVWIKDRSEANGAHVYDDPKARFSPTNLAFAPDGGYLHRRRLRFQLHPSVRPEGPVGSHLGRHRRPNRAR